MNPSLSATLATVVAQITRLPDLPMPEIRAIWQKLFGNDVPTHNRQFLERRIAYRLQEIEFRKVNPDQLEQNAQRIAVLVEVSQAKKRGQQESEHVKMLVGQS